MNEQATCLLTGSDDLQNIFRTLNDLQETRQNLFYHGLLELFKSTQWLTSSALYLHKLKNNIWEAPTEDWCFCFSRYMGQVTPKVNDFYFQKIHMMYPKNMLLCFDYKKLLQ